MMDANLIKNEIKIEIGKIIDINRLKPASFRQFSVGIVPATVSAAGFDLNIPTDKFSIFDWFMTLKFVNASKDNLIIEDIKTEWIGKNDYRCKSIYTQICEVYQNNTKSEEMIINQLNEEDSLKRQIVTLPILLKCQSVKFMRTYFSLKTYKRIFFSYWKPVYFKKEEIKLPETYEQLLQKAVIKIKINENRKPLLLRI